MSNTRQLARDSVSGQIPFVAQARPEEGRIPGLVLECPLCGTGESTYLHPLDSRAETRGSAYGSDRRLVTNVLLGCEGTGLAGECHIVVLEITNRKGDLNLGFRAPYSGEVVAEWQNGTFDTFAPNGGVRFNERFEVTA